jgi:hypothetical protein
LNDATEEKIRHLGQDEDFSKYKGINLSLPSPVNKKVQT